MTAEVPDDDGGESTPAGTGMNGRVVHARCRLRPRPESVGEARRFVRSVVDEAGARAMADTAVLVVSEVVTNAVLHAGTPVDVAVRAGRGRVRVEVADGSAQLPRPRSYDRLVSTGRGLHILDAVVDDWGVDVASAGKTVWFELTPETTRHPNRTQPGESGSFDALAAASSSRIDTSGIEVVLLDVPLLLHDAWQLHAQSLLREYVLTRVDQADAEQEMRAHAELNAALALLREQIGSPELQSDPDALMADATEPLVSADRLVVQVPEDSVHSFEALERALEAAAVLAESGTLLTVPMQPELRELRQWLCGQVRTQAAGEPPSAWSADPEQLVAPSSRRAAPRWEDELASVAADVARADAPMLAADDTNRILAVSPDAVRLLGYGGPEELVGHRLVTVIPERYRQAHVAGFTLHLLTGRAPLLEQPVGVPMRMADGSEIRIRLTVTARAIGARSVVLAEIDPC
jgi:PAS domain S-box-containing protein